MLTGALMLSIGAQWVVLQGVAWVGMAVSYSIREGSVTEGLSQTFDGKHPCPLCKAVKQAALESESQPSAPTPKPEGKPNKVDLCLFTPIRLFAPSPGRLPVEWESRTGLSPHVEEPDAPPPDARA